MTLQRTPDGYQNLGFYFAADDAGNTIDVPPGTAYASTDNGTGLNLPTADSLGGGFLIIENKDAASVAGLNAADGNTIDGLPGVILGATNIVMIVRTGSTSLKLLAFA